ncbi:cAMP-dependent protein kinase regulatory subunit [Hondaea fermentalgiana]|uniref:cAMP-dependent protein kinase regulatory subunit n=1 Tax=Hondaea fermentalgiana TaxID=2315210 RepID=A0A2R5G309_9STRA|nr:cAMP-dependent protein kinase regulatory subunit [Hondaea fermentalgiana]|eukprot:GBG25417.1 cAMP-dependent protein kinase regulatory subunit [Hondaea fermentalgiana]
MARQRTEQLIRAAVKELAEVPHTTQRLTIEKRASTLLEALHKSGGSKLLHELAEQQTTLVTLSDTTNTAANPGSNGEDTSSANEEDAADGNAALSKFDFGPLTLTVKRAGSTIDNALLARTANSTHAGQDNLSSGCRNGPLPQNRSLQEARRRVVRKLRLVGRMAVVMRNYRQEAEEKLRRRRIEERWDTVRQIAKASLAVLHMRKGVTTSVLSGAWFEDYPLLRRNLVVSPGQRSREAVRQIADELHRTRAFSDFSIPTPARRRIARSAELEAKERNKRANLETRIFGAKRAAELHQHAARHHGKEKKEASFTEVAVLRAGESFGGLGLRTVALGKRKASAIAVEYTELLRIEAVDYREVFMSHEMERIARPVRFLKGMPEFAMLVDDELTQLAYSVRATRFSSGTVISRQGQPIDDTLQFGIVTIGRCRRIKLLRHDGSEPTPGDLAQHAQSNQAGETDEDENKGAVSPQQPANTSGVTDQLQEYSFQSVGPGSILADRAALVDGQNTVHTHSCTVIADTCVEVYFIPRNSLVFALRNGGKFRELLRKLTPAPTPNKLRDLLEQRNMWIRFQQRFVRETLNETRKGQKIREAIDRSRLAAAHVEGPQLLHNVSHSRVEEDET